MISVRKVNKNDDLNSIALCIYLTDPYIYPSAFGEEQEIAVEGIKKLINNRISFFNTQNIIVARYDNKICGVLVYNINGFDFDLNKSVELANGVVPNLCNFKFTAEKYFFEESKKPDEKCIEIIACCVLPQYRKMGIGSNLINWLTENFKDYTFKLDVLASNKGAIYLYEKSGFVIEEKYKGFSLYEGKSPDCYHMVRK